MTRHDSGGWRGPPGRGSEGVQSRRDCGGERIVRGEQGLVQVTSDTVMEVMMGGEDTGFVDTGGVVMSPSVSTMFLAKIDLLLSLMVAIFVLIALLLVITLVM